MKTKKNKKRSLLRKLIKIFLWATAIFLLLLVVGIMAIRIKFPPNEIKRFIEKELSYSVNHRPVKIDHARLNPFKGFTFDNVRIYELPAQDSTITDSVKFLTIEKVYVKYKLSSLINRKLKIREILIDRPFIRLTVDEQNQTNIDDLLAPTPTPPQDTTMQDTTALSFLLAFELDQFNFKNFSAFIQSEMDSLKLQANIRDFSIYLKELSIPRGALSEINDQVKATLKMVSPNSVWDVYVESLALNNPFKVETKFDLNIDLLMNGVQNIELNGKMGFGETVCTELGPQINIKRLPVSQLVNLLFQINFDGEAGKVNIEQFNMHLADEPLFSLRGNIEEVFAEPYFDLSVENSNVRLSKLTDALKPLIPSDFQVLINGISVDGKLSFNDSKFQGNPLSAKLGEGLIFNTQLKLEDLNVTYPSPLVILDTLSINLSAKGLYNSYGLFNTDVNGAINLSKLTTELDDTTQVTINKFSASLFTNIGNDYFPTEVKLMSRIQGFFGAPISLDLQFKSSNKLQNYIADAVLDIGRLNLADLPLSPGDGVITGHFSMNSISLDQIIADLKISSDSIYLPSEDDEIVLSPIQLDGSIEIATDTLFQDFNLKRINLNVNDFLTIAGRGDVKALGVKGFEVVVDSAILDHRRAFNFIPTGFKEGLESFIIKGKSKLSAVINGRIPESGDPEIAAKSTTLIDTQINYPDIPMSIGSIAGLISLNSDGKSAKASGSIQIDSLILTGLRDQPLNNTTIKLVCSLPDFEQVVIDSGFLIVPELASTLSIIGTVDSLATNPKFDMKLAFDFLANDSMLVINDLYVLGNLFSTINLQYQQPLLTINGELNSNRTSAYFLNQIAIQDISGNIPFSQKIDIEKEILINDGEFKPFVADREAFNYNLLQPYYWNDDKKVSVVEIKDISIASYKMSDFLMNIHIGNGRIEIPEISMSLYDGNMRGNIFADLGSGDPQEIGYYLKANVSRLNSAKLSPLGSRATRAAELNMNMEFKGTGVDPTQEIDFSGYLYITKIGSKFTDNILNSLDPKGTDKSIQDAKRLLKWGYKPKLISFEIKHGYLYPTIHLVKGNIFTKLIPLNLSGGKIELARIPIKFFLETPMVQAK